jgi:hypothetical protein
MVQQVRSADHDVVLFGEETDREGRGVERDRRANLLIVACVNHIGQACSCTSGGGSPSGDKTFAESLDIDGGGDSTSATQFVKTATCEETFAREETPASDDEYSANPSTRAPEDAAVVAKLPGGELERETPGKENASNHRATTIGRRHLRPVRETRPRLGRAEEAGGGPERPRRRGSHDVVEPCRERRSLGLRHPEGRERGGRRRSDGRADIEDAGRRGIEGGRGTTSAHSRLSCRSSRHWSMPRSFP